VGSRGGLVGQKEGISESIVGHGIQRQHHTPGSDKARLVSKRERRGKNNHPRGICLEEIPCSCEKRKKLNDMEREKRRGGKTKLGCRQGGGWGERKRKNHLISRSKEGGPALATKKRKGGESESKKKWKREKDVV